MVVFPHAKINIGLFVTGKRNDGFHNLETIFFPVGWSDILEIGRGEGESGSFRFKNTGLEVGGDPGKNLVIKAYHLLAADFHLPAIQVHLHKIIPFGAGLGGGSADAAFMLKALNAFFDLRLSGQKMVTYAARLGSDCAFFIDDRPAFASGKGELREPIELTLAGYRIIIVKPSFGVSTPEAYAGITPRPAGYDLRQLGQLPVNTWKEYIRNDFEATVFQKYPSLTLLKQQLYERGAEFVSMSGSGSAIYGLFKKDREINLDFPDCCVWQGETLI